MLFGEYLKKDLNQTNNHAVNEKAGQNLYRPFLHCKPKNKKSLF